MKLPPQQLISMAQHECGGSSNPIEKIWLRETISVMLDFTVIEAPNTLRATILLPFFDIVKNIVL